MHEDVPLIANKIQASLEADNGCTFKPTPEVKARLEAAVDAALTEGVEFTTAKIDQLVAGDAEERARDFQHYASFPELDAAIEALFDSETGCLHIVVQQGVCLHCHEPAKEA